MARMLIMDEVAKNALTAGVNKVADTVKVTLGPRGRNVLIDRSKNKLPPLLINDGTSITNAIELENPFENMGASLMAEAATKTNELLGDGTTTTIVLAQAILMEGMKNMIAGANPVLLRNGIKKACEEIKQALYTMAVKVNQREQIKQIAAISSESEEIGELIAKAIDKTGRDGFITIEDAKTMETKMEYIQGMRLKSGYLSKIMCTDKEKKYVQFSNAYLLIADKEICDIQELLPILEKIVREKACILIIARGITGEALNTLVLNKANGIIQVAAIKAPGFGQMQKDFLEDIAVYTGGNVFDELKGMDIKNAELSDLGRAKSVQVQKENTIILEGFGNVGTIAQRIAFIQKQAEESQSPFNRERFRERISKLSNGIAVIQVGASSELEVNENKLKIENAIASTKAAIRGGVVPGGGSAYIYAQAAIDIKILENHSSFDELTGIKLLRRALESPLGQIASNAGLSSKVILNKQKDQKFPMGFDVEKEEFVNMFHAGIIDPVETEIKALECAVSVASTLLTAEAVNIIIRGTESIPTG